MTINPVTLLVRVMIVSIAIGPYISHASMRAPISHTSPAHTQQNKLLKRGAQPVDAHVANTRDVVDGLVHDTRTTSWTSKSGRGKRLEETHIKDATTGAHVATVVSRTSTQKKGLFSKNPSVHAESSRINADGTSVSVVGKSGQGFRGKDRQSFTVKRNPAAEITSTHSVRVDESMHGRSVTHQEQLPHPSGGVQFNSTVHSDYLPDSSTSSYAHDAEIGKPGQHGGNQQMQHMDHLKPHLNRDQLGPDGFIKKEVRPNIPF